MNDFIAGKYTNKGFYLVSTNINGVINGCLTNLAGFVSDVPERIAVSIAKTALTHDMIRKSGTFAVNVLAEDCPAALIRTFGLKSGREVYKFEDFAFSPDMYGNPCLSEKHAVAVISAKVFYPIDLGSHTQFVANISEVKIISEKEAMTAARAAELMSD